MLVAFVTIRRAASVLQSQSPLHGKLRNPSVSSTSERLEHVTAVSGGPVELHICRSARDSQSSPFRQKSTCHIVIFDFRQISSLSKVHLCGDTRWSMCIRTGVVFVESAMSYFDHLRPNTILHDCTLTLNQQESRGNGIPNLTTSSKVKNSQSSNGPLLCTLEITTPPT